MIEQLTKYLNELEQQLDVAEDALVFDADSFRLTSAPQNKMWFQLLTLRGERVSWDDKTNCSFDHSKSGHRDIS